MDYQKVDIIDNEISPLKLPDSSPVISIDIAKFDLVREKFPLNPTIAFINVNSLRNKFSMLSNMIKQNIDIFTIAETKLDETFSKNEFLMEGY